MIVCIDFQMTIQLESLSITANGILVATWEDRKFEAGEAIAPKLLLLGLLRPEGWGSHCEKKWLKRKLWQWLFVVCEDIILKLLQHFDATVTHDL